MLFIPHCRLLEQVPDVMTLHVTCWGKLVYPLLIHGAPRVRERAHVAMDKGWSSMMKQRESIARSLVSDLQAVRNNFRLF